MVSFITEFDYDYQNICLKINFPCFFLIIGKWVR